MASNVAYYFSGTSQKIAVLAARMGKYHWVHHSSILMSASIAFCTFFPLTAIFHHAVFYRPTCILNNFGRDYTPEVVLTWLELDPSPGLGLLCALLIFAVSAYFPIIRLAALAFAIATIPLSLWIWDIPFTGRIVCALGHDGRWPLRTFYLYILAAISIGPIFYWLRRNWVIRKAEVA